jgi:hypothetical protein
MPRAHGVLPADHTQYLPLGRRILGQGSPQLPLSFGTAKRMHYNSNLKMPPLKGIQNRHVGKYDRKYYYHIRTHVSLPRL